AASASMSRTSDSFGCGVCATGTGAGVQGLAAWTGFSAGIAGFAMDAGTIGCGIAGVAAGEASFDAGTAVVVFVGAGAADGNTVAGLVGSPLRSSPRATRSVPLACSTLMGLVSTRFAPIRNAF